MLPHVFSVVSLWGGGHQDKKGQIDFWLRTLKQNGKEIPKMLESYKLEIQGLKEYLWSTDIPTTYLQDTCAMNSGRLQGPPPQKFIHVLWIRGPRLDRAVGSHNLQKCKSAKV
jgi:hypothetical protein